MKIAMDVRYLKQSRQEKLVRQESEAINTLCLPLKVKANER